MEEGTQVKPQNEHRLSIGSVVCEESKSISKHKRASEIEDDASLAGTTNVSATTLDNKSLIQRSGKNGKQISDINQALSEASPDLSKDELAQLKQF